MSESSGYDDGAAAIEVRIYRDEQLIARELCESEDNAAAVVDHWSEVGNVSFLVDDLSAQHTPGDILAPEPPEAANEADPIANGHLPDRGVE
jgi:hypothetical protein